MSDTLGALSLPVVAPVVSPPEERDVAGAADPALVTLGSFAATVLQADCATAWEVLHPGRPDQPQAVDGERHGTGPVRRVWYTDPKLGHFSPEELPGLFVYRTERAQYPRAAADWYRRNRAIGLVWMPPRSEADTQRYEHEPFFNAVDVALSRAFVHRRHPSWVVVADQADEDALLPATVTSASPSTPTLTGNLAGTTLRTGRPVQVTTSAAAGAYNVTAPIVVTGILDSGVSHTDHLFLTETDGGETIVGTWSFRRITSIAVPAQLLTTGTFAIGYYASPDARFGSLVQRAAGFTAMQARVSEVKNLLVERPNDRPLPYRGLEFLVDVVEEHGIDAAEHAQFYDPDVAPGIDATIHQGNLNPFNSFVL